MSVVMYVKPGGPYCQAAREHLAAEGEMLEERDATQNSRWKAEIRSSAGPMRARGAAIVEAAAAVFAARGMRRA